MEQQEVIFLNDTSDTSDATPLIEHMPKWKAVVKSTFLHIAADLLLPHHVAINLTPLGWRMLHGRLFDAVGYNYSLSLLKSKWAECLQEYKSLISSVGPNSGSTWDLNTGKIVALEAMVGLALPEVAEIRDRSFPDFGQMTVIFGPSSMDGLLDEDDPSQFAIPSVPTEVIHVNSESYAVSGPICPPSATSTHYGSFSGFTSTVPLQGHATNMGPVMKIVSSFSGVVEGDNFYFDATSFLTMSERACDTLVNGIRNPHHRLKWLHREVDIFLRNRQ